MLLLRCTGFCLVVRGHYLNRAYYTPSNEIAQARLGDLFIDMVS